MGKTEALTRSEVIDQQLARAGWDVKDPTQVIEEFDILTSLPEGVAEPRTPYEGHQFSDYVLLGKDRKPLAVVEAKRTRSLGGRRKNIQKMAFLGVVDPLPGSR
jgi:type I restriction enzyme R subunit